MPRRIVRPVETLGGQGKLHCEGKVIAEVLYRLTVEQEYLVIDSSAGREEVRGFQGTSGTIRVIEGDDYLVGRDGLILVLDDGRGLQVMAKHQSLGAPMASIQILGSGPFITSDELRKALNN
jgi:hypothetical protein